MRLSIVPILLLASPFLLSLTEAEEVVIDAMHDPGNMDDEDETDTLSVQDLMDRSESYGVRQRVDENNEEAFEELLDVDDYMLEIFQSDDCEKVQTRCRNHKTDCVTWSAMGECERNPSYMDVRCSPACYSCDQVDIEAQCFDEKKDAVAASVKAFENQVYNKTRFTLDEFHVAGKNLASFGFEKDDSSCENAKDDKEESPFEQKAAAAASVKALALQVWNKARFTLNGLFDGGKKEKNSGSANTKDDKKEEPPFELFKDFDIGHLIRGDESWYELREYQRFAEFPTLPFYGDKVARKRWLASSQNDISQPKLYFASYFDEMCEGDKDIGKCKKVILENLPNNTDFVARPSHMGHFPRGDNIVTYDKENNETKIKIVKFDIDKNKSAKSDTMEHVAEHLSTFQNQKHTLNWYSNQIKTGITVEELFTHPDDMDQPAAEALLFVIWGRVWVGYVCSVGSAHSCTQGPDGFFYRNGTKAYTSRLEGLPDYIDWPVMVEMAEKLGANKDMVRIDMTIGVPSTFSKFATAKQRREAVQYVYNDISMSPKTYLWPALDDEGARLWIAGYKMGNYEVVPNMEVLKEWLESGGYYSAKE